MLSLLPITCTFLISAGLQTGPFADGVVYGGIIGSVHRQKLGSKVVSEVAGDASTKTYALQLRKAEWCLHK